MAKLKLNIDPNFEDLSSYSSTQEREKLRKKRKGRRRLTPVQVVIMALCVLLIIIGSVLIYISTDLLKDLTTNAITKNPDELGISSTAVMDDSITNVALFGVDARNDDFAGCSDVIMIFTVDNRHRKLKLSSVLRDSKVSVQGETLKGESIDWETKINAAYYEGGPELAIRTLNRNFGLNIEDYVTVNFSNMAAIVNAFDGIDVVLTPEELREINKNLWALSQEVEDQKEEDREEGTSEDHSYSVIRREDFFPNIYGELNVDSSEDEYTGGTFHLNGNQAVAYGRIRNVGDDYSRVERQQLILRQLIRRLPQLGVSDYPGLIREMMPYCETSLELDDIISMTPILFHDFTVESVSLPDLTYETDVFDGAAEDGINYVTYDLTAAADRLSAFLYEEDSPHWETYGNTGRKAQ